MLIALFLFILAVGIYGLIKREKAMNDYRKRKDPKCRECKKWGTIDCPSSKNCFATDTKPHFEKK